MKSIATTIYTGLVLLGLILISSCGDDQIQSEIPFVTFQDIRINLKSIQNLPLQNEGYLEVDGGVRGIIVYKAPFGNTYTAYERNCSYQPNNACAQVEVAASGLSMIDNCCKSTFEFSEGFPTGGPATVPLRRYRTSVSGDILTITDEPLN